MRISPNRLQREVQHAQDQGFVSLYETVAARYGLSPALLLAKDSRESCLGLCLDADYKGDAGNAWGLSQIDRRYHAAFTSTHRPDDHAAVIDYGAALLKTEIERFAGNVAAGLVAYNAGPDAVVDARAEGLALDTYTTGGDYSRDVISRKQAIEAMYPGLGASPSFQAAPGWTAGVLLAGGAVFLLYRSLQAR